MEAAYLRDVLTRLPQILKPLRRQRHSREIFYISPPIIEGPQPAFNYCTFPDLITSEPPEPPPQINIPLDFSAEKIDEGLPHVENEVRSCYCCGETRPVWQFPSQVTGRCEHEVGMCRSCLANWIEQSMKTVGWEKVACGECSTVMEGDEVKRGASEEVWKRYEQLERRARLSKIPNYFFCLGPDCTSGGVHDAEELGPKFTCECGFSSCVLHLCSWHESETCVEFDKNQEYTKQEADSAETIDKTTKKCPGCEAKIEKNEGCDHMTCSMCFHAFCWICLAAYGPWDEVMGENCNHKEDCLYHFAYAHMHTIMGGRRRRFAWLRRLRPRCLGG